MHMDYRLIFTFLWIIFILLFSSLAMRSGRQYQRTGRWGWLHPPSSLSHMYKEIAQYFVWFGFVAPLLVIILLAVITYG